jgi:hypothetical protein
MQFQYWVRLMYWPWVTGARPAYAVIPFPASARKRSPGRRRPIRVRIGWAMVQIGLRLVVGS